MEIPDFLDRGPDDVEPLPRSAGRGARSGQPARHPRAQPHQSIAGVGRRIGWVGGIVLALSSFAGWYAGHVPEGPSVAVVGWHTGALGKLVFFIGLVVIVLAALREVGAGLPPSVPQSLVVSALGTLATIFVLVRIISVPQVFANGTTRAAGIWISLIAGLTVIVAGLLEASEEL